MLLMFHAIALSFSDSREKEGSHSQWFMLKGKYFLPCCLKSLTSAEMAFVNSLVYLSSRDKCQVLFLLSHWAIGPTLQSPFAQFVWGTALA